MSFNRRLFRHDDTSARPAHPRRVYYFRRPLSAGQRKSSAIRTTRGPPQDLALDLIESVLTNNHKLFHKVCLSSPLPIGELYCMLPVLLKSFMFTAFRALTFITTPPLPPTPQNALRALCLPACPPQHPRCHCFTQEKPLRARDGGRSHLHTTHQTRWWRD
jgi:hypothetical protein